MTFHECQGEAKAFLRPVSETTVYQEISLKDRANAIDRRYDLLDTIQQQSRDSWPCRAILLVRMVHGRCGGTWHRYRRPAAEVSQD